MTHRTCWMCTLPISEPLVSSEISPPTIARHQPQSSQSKFEERSGVVSIPKDSTNSLRLPSDKMITIFVMSGSSQGMQFELLKPLMTIGRLHGGADIEIDDPEVSRSHCAVEVRHDTLLLHDLNSTNGTYIGSRKVFAVQLQPESIFRIGHSVLQIRIVPNRQLSDETSKPR